MNPYRKKSSVLPCNSITGRLENDCLSCDEQNVYISKDTMIDGDLKVTGSSLSFSDERIKTNICNIEDSENVLKINAKSFVMIDDIDKRPRYGFIAQNVHNVLPIATTKDENSDLFMVDQMSILACLVEEVKKLREELNLLKKG